MSDNGVGEATGDSGSGKHSAAQSTPLVLTKTGIPALTRGLDASDVLECYALVRQAALHGFGNATLSVKKMAIGIRYRPTPASPRNKVPMELTLEYGPQRLGTGLKEESLPFVVEVENNNGDRRDIDSDDNALPSPYAHLTWENEGRVYYTRQISHQTYTSAYYMASMTGAVLDTLLREAVDYSSLRRRYQPFAVYSSSGGSTEESVPDSSLALELKSSSSSDFVHYVWQHLVNLGVEVEPILEPPVYEARLHVTDIQPIQSEPAVTHQAATFYKRLYQCIEAIATNDHSRYTSAPTVSPITYEPTLTPDQSAPDENSTVPNPTDDYDEDTDDREDGDKGDTGDRSDNDTENDDDVDGSDRGDPGDDGGDRRSRELHERSDLQYARGLLPGPDDVETVVEKVPQKTVSYELVPDSLPSEAPTSGNLTFEEDGETNTDAEPTTSDLPQDAQQAANEAKAKADEAKEAAHTEGGTKAADAAQAAAEAAQKAADVTSNAAARAAMVGLLSGDGSIMTSIISSCFSDPIYGISTVDENGTLNTPAYLYKDGSRYYQLNLTSPFVEVVQVQRPIPKAEIVGKGPVQSGEFVDIALAWVFLFGLLLGMAMLLQQLGFRFFGALYRCQRWYFHPRKVFRDDEGDDRNFTETSAIFGEDAIPLSMGGRATVSPIRQAEMNSSLSNRSFSDPLDMPVLKSPKTTVSAAMLRSPLAYRRSTGSMGQDDFGDLELQAIGSTGSIHSLKRKFSDGDSLASMDDEFLSPAESAVPNRFMRDPDLVDLPHLKSMSKVAVPVGLKARNSGLSDDDNDKE